MRRLAGSPREASAGFAIVGARDGSPAARAGLRAGDIITHVRGLPAAVFSPIELRSHVLAGSQPEPVLVRVVRGFRPPFDVLLGREAATAKPVRVGRLAEGVVYIRIAALDERSGQQVAQGLADIRAAPGAGIKGVVLDLRDCGPGLIDQAIAIADAFLETGVIVATQSRESGAAMEVRARPGDIADGRPIAVLVNEGTAQAAEALAAALQENKRGHVLGSVTAGMGLVRSFVPVGNQGERGLLYLATERYLAPTGRQLDKLGVKPDTAIGGLAVQSDCRHSDIAEDDGAGLCVPRAAADDPAVRAALAFIGGEQVTVVKP